MLVLTRKSNQSIMIGDDIEVSVLSIMGEKVPIGSPGPTGHAECSARGLPGDRSRRTSLPERVARAEVDDALKRLSTTTSDDEAAHPSARPIIPTHYVGLST